MILKAPARDAIQYGATITSVRPKSSPLNITLGLHHLNHSAAGNEWRTRRDHSSREFKLHVNRQTASCNLAERSQKTQSFQGGRRPAAADYLLDRARGNRQPLATAWPCDQSARQEMCPGGRAVGHKSPLIRNRQVCSRNWSGRRESNPRHTAWEAVVLPLNYARAGPSIAKARRQQQGAKAEPRAISRGRTACAIRLWRVAAFCAGWPAGSCRRD